MVCCRLMPAAIIWKKPGWGRSLLVCREAFVLSEDLLDVQLGFRHDLQLFPLLCKVSVGLLEIENWELGIGNWRSGVGDQGSYVNSIS